jgi:alpha-beta hydrolase superfamily lysophospholipase
MKRILLTVAGVLAMTASAAGAGEREVSIDGGRAPLYGTLLTPDSARPGPAVLLIAGSGPTDRDGDSSIGGVKPGNLKLIAEGLAAHGVASLRYDKRGIGASRAAMAAEGDLRFGTYVDDAASFARFLQSQPGVTCVILAGHSEGALIAPLAAQKAKTCGVISISGMGRPLGVVIRGQLKAAGLPADKLAVADQILTELEHGREVPGIPAADPLFRPSVQPYLISQLTIDPVAALKAAPAPVLILQGETDIQVSVEDARLLAAGRPDATLVILPGVNHVLKAAPLDRAANIAAYSDPNLPLGPGVMEAIDGFVDKLK